MYRRLSYLFLPLTLLMMLTLASCKDHDDDKLPAYDRVADHTLLMYLIADNSTVSPSLSSSIETNVRDALAAAKDSVEAGKLNLVIYKDNDQKGFSLPELYWIRRNQYMKLDTVTLRTYSAEVNSASPQQLLEVLQTVFGLFPDSKVKGLAIGGHALGWTPSNNFSSSVRSSSRASQYIGIDSTPNEDVATGYMELWEFSDALRASGIYLDYLIFDACNMGNAEVAYQLRDRVHYMIGAVTEILGNGFPYRSTVTELSRVSSPADLPEHLKRCADGYFALYGSKNAGATISVYDLTRMDRLADGYFSLLSQSGRLSELRQLQQTNINTLAAWQSSFQQFGRSGAGSQYVFYDLGQWADYLDAEASSLFANRLSQVVIHNRTTKKFIEIDIRTNSGLTVSLPPCFRLVKGDKYSLYLEAYRLTDWGRRTLELMEEP